MQEPSLLMSFHALFKDSLFRVPDYQRGYAWQELQVRDLLEDLENIEDEKTHYTGTMVLARRGSKESAGEQYDIYEVIDGQQRLATILILLKCIADEYSALGGNGDDEDSPEAVAGAMRSRYLSKGKLQKLVLNDDCNRFFAEHIISDGAAMAITKTENASQENLLNAKSLIKDYLERKKGAAGSPDEWFPKLEELRKKVTSSIIVNRYVVESDAEAGVIFEVMNDRGKPLSQADKIKNYLIYLAYKLDSEGLAAKVNTSWGTIFKNLMASKRSSEDDFLRYHWIAYMNEYKEYDIHRRVKDRFRLKDEFGNATPHEELESDIERYVSDLEEASDVFFELNQPYSERAFSDKAYGGDARVGEIRDGIDRFHRFRNIANFYPFFISARQFFADDPSSFLEIIRHTELFAFRVYIVGNKRSNTGQTVFYRLGHKLHRGKGGIGTDKTPMLSSVIKEIVDNTSWYGSDDHFVRHLESKTFYQDLQSHEIKYFFYELELEKAREDNEEKFTASWEEIEKRSQVEHILPQHPKDYEQMTDEEKAKHEENVHRLGNLTITGWNQRLSNKEFWNSEKFTGKRKYYRKSNLRVQRELADHGSWGLKQIGQREKELVAFACARWKLPELKTTETGADEAVDYDRRRRNRDILKHAIKYMNKRLTTYRKAFPDPYKLYQPRNSEEAAAVIGFEYGEQNLEIYSSFSDEGAWPCVIAHTKAGWEAVNELYRKHLMRVLPPIEDFDGSEWSVCYGHAFEPGLSLDEWKADFIEETEMVVFAIGEVLSTG